MITFKNFLNEKAMNSGEFEKTALRQATKAKVGFEFEMVVPEGSTIYADVNEVRDFETLRNIDSFDEVWEYFEVSRGGQREVMKRFEQWAADNEEEWIEDNLDIDQKLVDSEGESYAKEEAEAAARSRYENEIATFDEYIESEYGSVYKFIDEVTFDAKYGWEADLGNDSSRVYTSDSKANEEQAQDEVFKNIERELSDHLGVNVTTLHHGVGAKGHFTRGDWIVVPDGSIEHKGNFVGAEVVSPPTLLGDALKDLEAMFKWMDYHDIVTNFSTGLHINVSLPGIENVDLLKLVLFMGDKHVLKQFGRLSNTYSTPQTTKIIDALTGTGELPKEAEKMIYIAKSALSSDKYRSVNIGKLKDGYLEFRVAGNADYQKDYTKIRNTVLRFVSALEIAIDPKAERNEYLKKVSSILSAVEKQTVVTKYDKISLVNIVDFASIDTSISSRLRKTLEVKAKQKPFNEEEQALIVKWFNDKFSEALMDSFRELNILPSDRHRAEFKLIMKKLGITKEDIMKGNSAYWIVKNFQLQK